ncbi:MAG: arylsulfatase [Clostridiaceae bacterium]|nr:arylsulfatase [Clostridiaceae bacterium]
MKKPNVIIILADDLGYGDVSCFNPESKIHTENIDRLANEGMRFTDSHATSALCTPSRYGLLTGRYNWRSRLKSYVLPGDSESLIEYDRKTLAHMLKENGYNTAVVGKWHLGLDWQLKDKLDFEKYGLDEKEYEVSDVRMGRNNVFDFTKGWFEPNGLDIDYSKPITFGPNQLGFDYFFGTAASLDQPPFVYIENDRALAEPTMLTGEFDLDRRGASQQQKWEVGPIAPGFKHQNVCRDMQAKVLELIDKFTDQDQPFFLYYPTHMVHGPLIPDEEYQGKSGVGIYGDFVLQLDDYVGQIIDKLKEKGVFEDTIVIFSSDNGASGVADIPGLIQQGHNPSYHFRGTKFDIWEGGHREPTIVSYPRVIKAGSVSDQLVCHTDFYRTLAELIGVQLADNEAEDSVSNLALWQGNNVSVREDVIHSSANGAFSIRRGSWKLIFVEDNGADVEAMLAKPSEGKFKPYQLYYLQDDIEEKNNVIEKYPEIVEKLQAILEDYIRNGRSTPGVPQPNGRNNPDGDWPQISFMKDFEEVISKTV